VSEFTHFDVEGNAVMVDVSDKEKTARHAKAVGYITMSAECYNNVCSGAVKKGDVLSVARIAGIMATKQTSSLIPLCHTLPIEKASIKFDFDEGDNAISITLSRNTLMSISGSCWVETTDRSECSVIDYL